LFCEFMKIYIPSTCSS